MPLSKADAGSLANSVLTASKIDELSLARAKQSRAPLESDGGMDDLADNILFAVIGAVLGVAGTVAGQSLIEWKRGRSDRSKRNGAFRRVEAQMPSVIGEMRTDLKGDGSLVVREIAIIPSRNLIFNSSKRRFVYYEDEHEDLRPKIDILEQAGFLELVRSGDFPFYRMSDEFVELLVTTAAFERH